MFDTAIIKNGSATRKINGEIRIKDGAEKEARAVFRDVRSA
jgi:hypothetical protein